MRYATRIPLLTFVAVLCAFAVACDDVEDIFDDGPSDEPNFTAEGVGENQVTDLLIEILATREGRNVSGQGTFVIDGEDYDIEVVGASLPTDFNGEPPIPQTDDLSPFDYVCTPRYAHLDVVINPGGFETTMRLNECEDDNSDIFVEDGVIYNPCNDDEPVADVEAFNGVCLSDPENGVDFGRDSMVIDEFDGKCTAEAPCVVPRDVLIFVPSMNDHIDAGDIIDDIIDNF